MGQVIEEVSRSIVREQRKRVVAALLEKVVAECRSQFTGVLQVKYSYHDCSTEITRGGYGEYEILEQGERTLWGFGPRKSKTLLSTMDGGYVEVKDPRLLAAVKTHLGEAGKDLRYDTIKIIKDYEE